MNAGKKLALAFAASLLTLMTAGCGDNKPVVFKQGQYQGKPDSKPWDNDRFKGNQVEWEKSIKARNQGQDEYSRAVANSN
jgi:hypothetical protein